MRENAHDAAKRLGDNAQRDVVAPDIHIDTFGYDLGVAALLSVGLALFFTDALVGAALAGAAPVLAYYLKRRVDAQTKEKAQEQAAVALREAAAKVAPKLDQMVEDFTGDLDAWVEKAGKEVHREMLDILQASKAAHKDATPDVARIEKECAAHKDALDNVKSTLEQLRKSLWDADAVHATE